MTRHFIHSGDELLRFDQRARFQKTQMKVFSPFDE